MLNNARDMIDFKEVARLKNKIAGDPDEVLDIIESTPLAICITDDRGNFVAVNKNYCRMYGYRPEEMIGKSFLMVVPPDQRPFLQEAHDHFIIMKDEILRNWQVRDKAGQLFPVFADAGFSDRIFGGPHKITFIWPRDKEYQDKIKGRISQ